MYLQVAYLRKSVVTLVAFVTFFSTVRLQMRFQIACLRRCKVTLIAFVWFFPTVYFQMFHQAAFPRRWKVALVTLIRLFSIVDLSHWNHGPAFNEILLYHQQTRNVLSCVILVSNWDKFWWQIRLGGQKWKVKLIKIKDAVLTNFTQHNAMPQKSAQLCASYCNFMLPCWVISCSKWSFFISWKTS